VIATPWGDSRDLRGRKLRPGPGASREEVEANQRERIFGAMVAAVAEHGYEATRVADVLELSGVSRNTFYKHFDNKLDCFLATMDAVILRVGPGVIDTYTGHEGPWDARLTDGFGALTAALASQPAAARLFYVESAAAGPEAVAKVNAFGDRIFDIARRSLEESPDYAGMPYDVLRAVLRGMRRTMQTRLRKGREAELAKLAPELMRWSLSYRTPPEPLRLPSAPPTREFQITPRDLEDPRERIMSAVIELMADKGYQALTITDIAQRAAVSLTTFYRLFKGKDDVAVAALRRSTEQIVEAVGPAFHAPGDWSQAVGDGLRAFFGFLVAERPYARFGGVDVHSGSPLILDVREQLMSSAESFIAEDTRDHPPVTPLVGEAIGASVDALIFDQITRHGERRLYEITPVAIYLALTPFVGAEEACAIANQDH
jgi:AcrR family transcriptional regulator